MYNIIRKARRILCEYSDDCIDIKSRRRQNSYINIRLSGDAKKISVAVNLRFVYNQVDF